MKITRGMVFGVFDGLHDGHKYFLREASKQCDELVVTVASDKASTFRKGFAPAHPLVARIEAICMFDPTFIIAEGDEKDGSWKTLEKYFPDRVFVGYDQRELRDALVQKGVSVVSLSAFNPSEYKSSILNRKT